MQLFGYTILLDPGHGGEDDGAKGELSNTKFSEKDLALTLAKKISKRISRKHRVYLTRTYDKSVSLEKRAEIAEKLSADLFVSIHVNASTRKSANGFETYYLDHHKDAAVKKIESIENRNLKGQELVVHQILTDLIVDRTTKSSRRLGQAIHSRFNKGIKSKFKVKDRGLKPGLFYVLALTKRPAVLLEIGFISNSRELKKLTSESFQDEYARNVADGIMAYLKVLKKEKPPLF
ncbi:MAG: N-acetylmuramoyl-L-alanine amidase [Bacteriovoracaceae bacterium]|jgi:N-acetylmuramoyl-L-alanine amidase